MSEEQEKEEAVPLGKQVEKAREGGGTTGEQILRFIKDFGVKDLRMELFMCGLTEKVTMTDAFAFGILNLAYPEIFDEEACDETIDDVIVHVAHALSEA